MVEVKKLASSREKLKANVLLVHGLGVGTKETWQTTDKKSYLHEWLSASLPSVGIWQVDYDAAKTEWVGHSMALPDRARNILNALIGHEELVSKPLIIIAHSFGGLIVKSLSRSAETSNNSEYKKILSNIKSVVFLGTPHSGAILASFGNWFSRLFRPSSASKTLNLDNPDIRELGTNYREITDRMGIVHLVFYESRPMKGLGLIVSAASADPGLSKQTGAHPILTGQAA